MSYDQGKTWEIIGQATGKDGKDGKDGICPQLKIENGVWYISYDNGVTWEAIGSAVGQDGKTPSLKIEDGKLMISWDQGVTWEMVEGGDVFGELSKPGTGVAEGHKWINLGLPRPFPVELPKYNRETLEAMAEARKISRDPDVKGYTSMADLKAALEADD